MGNGFAPKEIIEAGNQRLQILSAETTDTYGPQCAFGLKVIGGPFDGHTFVDYANRDEDTGDVKQGSKAWTIFESCLGPGFHKKLKDLDDALDKLTGRQLMAKVTQTKTNSRNKLEHGTIGPIPPGEESAGSGRPRPPDEDSEDDFDSLPF